MLENFTWISYFLSMLIYIFLFSSLLILSCIVSHYHFVAYIPPGFLSVSPISFSFPYHSLSFTDEHDRIKESCFNVLIVNSILRASSVPLMLSINHIIFPKSISPIIITKLCSYIKPNSLKCILDFIPFCFLKDNILEIISFSFCFIAISRIISTGIQIW